MNANTNNQPTQILVIDDHRYIHDAVELALSVASDLLIVGHGSDGHEAIALAEALQPDIILMDVVMSNMDGLEATRQIHQHYPKIMILALSSYNDDESVRQMLREGASGYIPKDTIASSLVSTLRSAMSGNVVLPSTTLDLFIRTPETIPQPSFDLTERELEVLKLIAEGMTNPQIAGKLYISQSTVKFHLANILRKMEVDTRAEAIVIAAKSGLV